MNLQPLIDSKASILADPKFDMAKGWEHCIAGHICRAAGILDMQQLYTANFGARQVLGITNVSSQDWKDTHFLFCSWPSGESQSKEWAIYAIDKFIADHQPEPQPNDVPEAIEERELVEELVGV